MGHKEKLFILLPMLAILLFSQPVFADTSDLTEKSGMLPTSKLYFLKTWGEWARVNVLTLNKEKKAELYLKFAEKRLAELDKLKENGTLDEKQTEKLTKKYELLVDRVENHIEKKKEKNEDDTEIASKVTEKMTKHQKVLRGVRDRVPESAKKAIDNAREVSSKGEEKAMERLLERKTKNKDDDKFTAEKIRAMITDLKKHIDQREDKLNKWEAEGKDVTLSRQELGKARSSLRQAEEYIANKEYRKAYDVIRQGKQYISGLERFVDDLEKMPKVIDDKKVETLKEKVKDEFEKNKLEERIKEKVKEGVKEIEVKRELKEKVKTGAREVETKNTIEEKVREKIKD